MSARPDDLQAVLRERGSGLYDGAAPAEQVLDLARREGWTALHLDTTAAPDKVALLEAVQRDLALPDWFGRNWDALADALSDLRAEPGVLVAWTGSDDVDPAVRRTAVEILQERADEGEGGFVVVLIAG
ncbi:barstar family protein [Luteipulveratus halotolerans]|uniref:Barstar (barnase inhibitor) domain-containing protein n=1 Tax=Luteipulveratus halotolerans TaxID=1631356 RepID=A0A0L6CJ76_9MICO|nr:barstar family protein [Luteipulveratus halotolerans]KNX37851.1 hypothetical protein VV01_12920 [Luteipulveratus halotolerans]